MIVVLPSGETEQDDAMVMDGILLMEDEDPYRTTDQLIFSGPSGLKMVAATPHDLGDCRG